ncbi:mitochondrial inner membrane protease subunit 1-like [Pyrus ussuriensis x Pyrus communis]|uniref:Mitochondrial inner membrane protease subunit 1-like n=1 Tax=Pyrus ussuriensis x Pyrus communis TaxID=2448454 RepID=A0A5N5FEA8_9ROSA|nr:mitochondrial inner membrane protease subunit 1-like [Pyrus ussuriensis x Pyrus communis]KAB2637219.1 mitochondrial inner membrane protease subunit 1-like [Pyrus ussuriensis x Pyrus communis]
MALRYMRQFLASEAFENAGREISDVILRLVKFVCCLQVTNTHLLTVALCYGPSMILTIGLAGAWLNDPVRQNQCRRYCHGTQSVTYVVDPKNSDRSETSVVCSYFLLTTLQCSFCFGFFWFSTFSFFLRILEIITLLVLVISSSGTCLGGGRQHL